MKKFSLSAARQQLTAAGPSAAAASVATGDIATGIYCVRITQVVGLAQHFDTFDKVWKEGYVGLTFQLADGRTFGKVINAQAVGGHWSQIAAALPSEADGLQDVLGQKLVIDLVGNRQWPRVQAFYALESGLVNEPAAWPDVELICLEPSLETGTGIDTKAHAGQVAKLSLDLRKAVMATPPRRSGDQA